MALPKEIKKLIETFSNYPGLGPRQATRIVFFIIQQGKNEIEKLNSDFKDLRNVKICPYCFFPFFSQENLCSICSDEKRDKQIIAIIEKETDLVSIEKSKIFNGCYFILGELSKKEILEPSQKLRLKSLKERIKKESGEKIKEIILCFPASTYGDFNVALVKEEIKNFVEKITHLSRGLPTGGEIEFADKETLKGAMENRK